MKKYSFIVGEKFINVINIETGVSTVVMADNPMFDAALGAVKRGDFAGFETKFNAKEVVKEFVSKPITQLFGSNFSLFFDGSQVFYSYKDGPRTVLHNAIVSRIIDQAKAGFDVKPLTNFMCRLLENPNPTSIDELYLFLDACKLPITEDGYFIAYKIVKNDYMDIFSGTMRNAVGDTPEMPRFEVDTNRNNTCSKGLHFCSKEYLNSYGSSNRDNDRAMLVKIDPADVVSIPSDYNNAKGRAWRYEVIGEVPDGWRATLPIKDYTDAPIVDANGEDGYDLCEIENEPVGRFTFNKKTSRWHDLNQNNKMVSRFFVASTLDCTVADLREHEDLS